MRIADSWERLSTCVSLSLSLPLYYYTQVPEEVGLLSAILCLVSMIIGPRGCYNALYTVGEGVHKRKSARMPLFHRVMSVMHVQS